MQEHNWIEVGYVSQVFLRSARSKLGFLERFEAYWNEAAAPRNVALPQGPNGQCKPTTIKIGNVPSCSLPKIELTALPPYGQCKPELGGYLDFWDIHLRCQSRYQNWHLANISESDIRSDIWVPNIIYHGIQYLDKLCQLWQCWYST